MDIMSLRYLPKVYYRYQVPQTDHRQFSWLKAHKGNGGYSGFRIFTYWSKSCGHFESIFLKCQTALHAFLLIFKY